MSGTVFLKFYFTSSGIAQGYRRTGKRADSDGINNYSFLRRLLSDLINVTLMIFSIRNEDNDFMLFFARFKGF